MEQNSPTIKTNQPTMSPEFQQPANLPQKPDQTVSVALSTNEKSAQVLAAAPITNASSQLINSKHGSISKAALFSLFVGIGIAVLDPIICLQAVETAGMLGTVIFAGMFMPFSFLLAIITFILLIGHSIRAHKCGIKSKQDDRVTTWGIIILLCEMLLMLLIWFL